MAQSYRQRRPKSRDVDLRLDGSDCGSQHVDVLETQKREKRQGLVSPCFTLVEGSD